MRSRLLLVTLLTAFGFAPGTAGPTHARQASGEAQLTARVKTQQQRIEQLQRQIRVRSGAEPARQASRGGSFHRGSRYNYNGYRHTSRTSTSGHRYRGYGHTSWNTGSQRRSYGWWNGYKWTYGTQHPRYRSGSRSYGGNSGSYYRPAPGRTDSRTTDPSARKPASAPRQPTASASPPIKPPTQQTAPHVNPVPSAALPRTPSPAQHPVAAPIPPEHNVLVPGTPAAITADPTRPAVPPTTAAGSSSFEPTLPPSVAGVTAPELPKAPQPLPAEARSVALVSFGLLGLATLFGIYTLRHYYFTINRLFGIQRHPYIDVDTAEWPTVSVFVDARGDATGSASTLGALLEAQYPAEKLRIRVVPPSGAGRARDMLEEYARLFGGRLSLCSRAADLPCGTAALSVTAAGEDAEILLYFEAGCVPGKGLIKRLVAPFFDPEVGAVMGRPVTANVGSSLLTRLLDLELSGGYQVDQQASMNWDQVVRIGGPVGGMRRSALESIGGWGDDAAGDVDLACRLLLKGWKTVYENRAECYEDVPENWAVQTGRVTCCAWQFHRALLRHGLALLTSRQLGWGERWEGLLQLGSYAASLLLVVGWLFALGLLFLGANPFQAILALLLTTWLGGLGSTPTAFGIAAAAHLDGHRRRIRLLPLHLLYALVSLVAVAGAAVSRPRRVQHARTAELSETGLMAQECIL